VFVKYFFKKSRKYFYNFFNDRTPSDFSHGVHTIYSSVGVLTSSVALVTSPAKP
jgi:hypothetical protein